MQKVFKNKPLNEIEQAANTAVRKAIVSLQRQFAKLNPQAAAIALKLQAEAVANEEGRKDLYQVMAGTGLKPANETKPGLAKTRPAAKGRRRAS